MRFSFKGKNISVFDEVKEQGEKKLSRIAKLVPEDAEVSVAISKNHHEFKVEVSMPLHKRILRAEVVSTDVNNAFDDVVDVLERQVVKYRGRLRERSRRNKATAEEEVFMNVQPEPVDATEFKIHRTKRFALKPMEPLDAAMEMDLVGHSFFVFRNSVTDEVNVIYKRNDGDYGLIEPQ